MRRSEFDETRRGRERGMREVRGEREEDAPIVTTTLKSPRATRSVMSSMSASAARGSLSFSYVVRASAAPALGTTAVEVDEEEEEGRGVEREGASEKSEGARTR